MYITRRKAEYYWWSEINIIMKYQKIINLSDNTPNQQPNLERQTGLK